MMYLTEECGRSIGSIVAASGFDAEVEITIDSVIIRFRKEESKQNSKNKTNAHLAKTAMKKRKWHDSEKITFNGESLTRKEWAEKLGITVGGVSYRIQHHGNPYGSTSPKPSDSDKVVAAS